MHPPNELGYAKVSSRETDVYLEGIVDAAGKLSSNRVQISW
ncbi:MAG: hypothetical protein ACK52L_07080 [Pirellula sp.]